MGNQVGVVFPTNLTLLKFSYSDKKSFSSSLYQLKDTKLENTRPLHDRICPIGDTIYAGLLVQSKNHLVKIKRTLK